MPLKKNDVRNAEHLADLLDELERRGIEKDLWNALDKRREAFAGKPNVMCLASIGLRGEPERRAQRVLKPSTISGTVLSDRDRPNANFFQKNKAI
jgi:hypothetical protein